MMTTALIAFLVLGLSQPVAAQRSTKEIAEAARQTCRAEAVKRFSRDAAELTDEAVPPKKRRNTKPDGRKVGAARGLWIGEALLGPTGNIEQVWSLRGIHPEADAAIEEAVQKWQYTPFTVAGEAAPLCFGVTVRLR